MSTYNQTNTREQEIKKRLGITDDFQGFGPQGSNNQAEECCYNEPTTVELVVVRDFS